MAGSVDPHTIDQKGQIHSHMGLSIQEALQNTRVPDRTTGRRTKGTSAPPDHIPGSGSSQEPIKGQ